MLALLACTCPTFEEMSVTDSTGVATEAERTLVQEVIDTFAAATGREGVCVPGVELRPADDPALTGIAGRYRGRRDTIFVEQGLMQTAYVTRHELCHALDTEEDLSTGRADLFPPESITDHTLYPTEVDRVEEAFAIACGQDPSIDLVEALASCGDQTDAEAWLRDEVYPFAPTTFDRVPVTLERHALAPPEGAELRNLSVLGSDAAFLTVYWAEGHDSYARDVEISTFDLGTSARGPMVTLPTGTEEARFSVVGGADEALVFVSRDTTEVWSVDLDAGTRTAVVGFPELASYAEIYGTIVDGTLWFTDIAASTPTLRSFELDTGVSTTVDWPAALEGERVTPLGWIEVEGRLIASDHTGLLIYDLAQQSWEIVEPPGGPALMATTRIGRQLVSYTYIHTADEYYRSLLLYDLDTGRWGLPDDPCVAAAIDSGRPVTVGDTVWVWEGNEAGTVARVTLD